MAIPSDSVGYADPRVAVAVAAVIVAFVAVIAALLKEEIVRIWRRPQFKLRVLMRSPDCYKGERLVSAKEGQIHGACYYFRIWVENYGRQHAEKVQVYAARLLEKNPQGVFDDVPTFVPMGLRWATGDPMIAEVIPPKMGRHCEIGSVLDPKVPDAWTDLFAHPRKQAHPRGMELMGESCFLFLLHLEAAGLMARREAFLLPGTYRLELIVAAANAFPKRQTFEIALSGHWSKEEQEMFSDKGVSIVVRD